MTYPTPYFLFPGTAREAMEFYRDTFGGELQLFSLADFGRTDGPADAIAHSELNGPVTVQAADAAGDEDALVMTGMHLSILGTEPALLTDWFDKLAASGRVIDPLERPWGDHDGQVVDAYGVRWLIGFKG